MSNSVIIKTATSTSELKQILLLQEENHTSIISVAQKEKEGFVTVRHNLELLKSMNNASPQIIAVSNNKVVGYALVMLQEFRPLIPELIPMFDMLDSLHIENQPLSKYSFYVMGQICIAKEFRGQGIFDMLYLKHKELLSSNYDFCITEVSISNFGSLKAHDRVGFKTIHRYRDHIDDWKIMALDLRVG